MDKYICNVILVKVKSLPFTHFLCSNRSLILILTSQDYITLDKTILNWTWLKTGSGRYIPTLNGLCTKHIEKHQTDWRMCEVMWGKPVWTNDYIMNGVPWVIKGNGIKPVEKSFRNWYACWLVLKAKCKDCQWSMK